ncbi:hypothetical protein GCM10023310_01010 [Paenibacillus vulneris]|uniref:Phage tail protein n=1 Tax=Paenibacillus vulneris TaxID=1133364 RepID=A0ABW3V0Q1_9BACL
MSDFPITSPVGERLLGRLPKLYSDILESRAIAESEGVEFESIYNTGADIEDQRFVEKATWGISLWEKEFGIVPSLGQPYEQRRSVVRSKIRGTGLITVKLFQKVAQAYDKGEIEVTQKTNLYQIVVRFVSTIGVPPNIDNLKAALEDIKPAHLDIVYIFKYTLYNDIKSKNITYDDIKNRNITYHQLLNGGLE